MERINNEMYENLFDMPEPKKDMDTKKSSAGYMESMMNRRKFKSSSVNQILKEKL